MVYDEDGNLTATELVGDMDEDGDLDTVDNTAIYCAADPQCDFGTLYPGWDVLRGDCDNDGDVDMDDYNLFNAFQDLLYEAWTYTWDAENRLIQVAKPGTPTSGDQKFTFAYDYMGRRVRKQTLQYGRTGWSVVADTKVVWAGWLLLLEQDGTDSDAVLRKYTWGLDVAGQNGQLNSLASAGGIGGLLAVYDTNGTTTGQNPTEDDKTYVYLYDANGNVGQLVDWVDGYEGATGSQWHADRMVATYEYTPYGTLRASAGDYADENPFRFSTKQWDDETGLGYWGYRYYSPTLGRWISRDAMWHSAGDNLYSYGPNSPQSGVDPDGRDWIITYWVDHGPYHGRTPPSPPEGVDWPRPSGSVSGGVSQPKGCCGMDVTRRLRRAIDGIETAFYDLVWHDKAKVGKICDSMISPNGWDIGILSGGGLKLGADVFSSQGCGTGTCQGSVQVDGVCYRAGEVNYILWGVVNRLCYTTHDYWTETPGLDGPVVRGTGQPAPRGTWSLDRALGWIGLHRFVAGLNPFSEPPASVGGGSTRCRKAWTRAGWNNDWTIPRSEGCNLEECETVCCDEEYPFEMRVTLGNHNAWWPTWPNEAILEWP